MRPKNKIKQTNAFLKKKKKKKKVRGQELRQGIELKVNASPSLGSSHFMIKKMCSKKHFHEIGTLLPGLLCIAFSCSRCYHYRSQLSEKWIKKYLSILQPPREKVGRAVWTSLYCPSPLGTLGPAERASKIRHEALQQPPGLHACFSSPTPQGHRWVPHLPLVHPSLPLQAVPLPGEQSPPPWSVCT